MKTITFGSLKGGVSKTTTALLCAYCLAKAGKKILFIDGDINNSSSWTLSPENKNELDPQGRKHIAAALQGENLLDFVIPSNTEGIDLIPSSLYLVDLRTINQNRFKSLVKSATLHFSLAEKYDYIIIDTAPTYDNITMMFYEASDLIITPTLLSQFDYNTALFLNNKLLIETNVYENWKLLFVGWNRRFEEKQIGGQTDYQRLFENTFSNILSARIPWTTAAKNRIDRQMLIGKSNKSATLHFSIIQLCEEISGEKITLEGKEAF